MDAMKIALIAGAAFLAGAALGFLLGLRTIIVLRRRIRALRAGGADKKNMETTKRVIWACLIMGFAWVWCSYALAYLDRAQIAESLSQVAVTEIIGVVLVYCVKSAIENLSKNNHWPDKNTADDTDSATGPEPEQDELPDVGQ